MVPNRRTAVVPEDTVIDCRFAVYNSDTGIRRVFYDDVVDIDVAVVDEYSAHGALLLCGVRYIEVCAVCDDVIFAVLGVDDRVAVEIDGDVSACGIQRAVLKEFALLVEVSVV